MLGRLSLLGAGRVHGLEHSCSPRVFSTRRGCDFLLFLSLCWSAALGSALTVIVVGFLAASLAALVGSLVVHRFGMSTVYFVRCQRVGLEII